MRGIYRMLPNTRPRWCVAVLEGDLSSRSLLRAAVEEAGGRVALEAPVRLDAVDLLRQTRPDVMILAPSLSSRGEESVMPRLTAAVRCPAVLFTRDTGPAVLRQAKRAGIMGFMLKPLRAAEVAPTLDLALARFREILRLQQARADRPLVDRAKGRLMTHCHLTEEEAFRWLRQQAMDTRRRIGDVARAVLAGDGSPEVAATTAR